MRIVNYSEFSLEPRAFMAINVVRRILNDVKERGDAAVKEYTEKFDGVKLESLEVSKREIKAAYRRVDRKVVNALRSAANNIAFFAKKQMALIKNLNFKVEVDGVTLGQRVLPLGRVGCYVPGGRYPLPSSALMSVIPAKVAGVKEVIVCSPKINQVTIVAADLAGADRIFRVGGVQAIGAMAYGTESIPKVDKIVGPGNNYVVAAKKEVYGLVGVDFLAGPSEVMIIADEGGNSKLIAADLLAQAEHDPNAKPILVTTSRKLGEKVNEELKTQLKGLRNKRVAQLALNKSVIILVENLRQAVELSNRIAPEHLMLQVKNPERIVGGLKNYGALFLGEYSTEVFGDYCSGTNHILPTGGAARYTGGLSVMNFIKILTWQKVDAKGVDKLAETALTLAEVEGLEAHKKAVELRKMMKKARK